MIDKLKQIEIKFHQIEEKLTDPEIIGDHKRYADLNREYKELKEIVDISREYINMLDSKEVAQQMIDDSDPELKEMGEMEMESITEKLEELEGEIKVLLLPKDPDDHKDVIMEIRSGAGGDEASIFAGDLYRMYSKYFETKGWKHEILFVNEGTAGGYNKIEFEVSGESIYGFLKFESGAHRVQRVPKTESQGRVHTSAATVVVMPKLEMEDVDIKKSDLKVDTFRSSGAGGQHVNKTESGVRFTHLPTGVVSESTDGRSQIKNREIALQRLYQKIYESQKQSYESEQAAKRKSLVGSGDRSDKIRTYNYPQNRVTDHRINLTLYSLDKIIEGDLDEVIENLRIYENTEKMKELE
ncbi:peptide chain release factor 1 [Membranihabitans maritimus]|uniref:peptide chain release factor 1 n=1 Tax=Membranihabitans maritimus TaxID=2904244 RepID=UPI001F01FFEA|nr:peptide chain release factor 1 [Membranihabitans maritimus]